MPIGLCLDYFGVKLEWTTHKFASLPSLLESITMCSTCVMHIFTSNEKILKCKKVGIEKKVKKQDGMSTIIVNYSDKIIRR